MGKFQTPPSFTNDINATPRAKLSERVRLPLMPEERVGFELDVYNCFMRHLRQVTNSRQDIKVLTAIQFTADMMDLGDALVAKTVVDLGLRAPRAAFPSAFLDFADRALQRTAWDVGGNAQGSILGLRDHWEQIGENRFAPLLPGAIAVYSRHHATVN